MHIEELDDKEIKPSQNGLLRKLNLSHQNRQKQKEIFEQRFNLLTTNYGADFYKVLGQKGQRIEGVEKYAKMLEDRKEMAESFAKKGNYSVAFLTLDAIDNLVTKVGKTLRGELGDDNKLSLQSFGRSKRLSREEMQAKTKDQIQILLSRCKHLPKEMHDDVGYCLAILYDSGETIRLLSKLDEAIEKKIEQAKIQKQDPEHLLTSALREKEEKHCFPDIKALPVGVLSSKTFQGMTAWGWQAKDPGPGMNHGDNTHRLQWFALMERFEEDLAEGKPWKYTPFELFTMIGDLDREKPPESSSIWGKLMDSSGGHIERGETKNHPHRLGSRKGAFNLPDGANGILCSLGEMSDSPLAKLIKARYDKRYLETWKSSEEKTQTQVWKEIEKEQAELQIEYDKILKKWLWSDLKRGLQKLFNDKKKRRLLSDDGVAQFRFEPKDKNESTRRLEQMIRTLECPLDKIDQVAYRDYMEVYAKTKREDVESGYKKPIDDEDLLVAQNTKDGNMATMSDEEKMKLVKELQLKSREKFGLDKK